MSGNHQSSKAQRWGLSVLLKVLGLVQCLLIGSGPGLLQAAPADAGDAAQQAARLAIGQRIYREGLLPSGAALSAVGAAQTRLSGQDVACATCHRRSGYGTTEGKFTIRPITGPALLQEDTVAVRSPRIRAQLGVHTRPPYNRELLSRAVRGGVDASGKSLDALMPRYALSDDEMSALADYLFVLSAQHSPGVDEQEIHFATVIQPGVDPAKRRAMLEVMQAFVKDKVANARSDEQRRQAGVMRMQRAYRKWVLHVWELSGPSDTWGAQLDGLYRQQPVFALVGGLGTSSWRPIHEFSERLEIPALLPQVDLPVIGGSSFYTVYFSKGLTLEAEVLASFLREPGAGGKVMQVYRRDETGLTAAAALRAALAGASAGAAAAVSLQDVVLEGQADAAFWRALQAAKPDAIVLWLGAQDLDLPQALGGAGPTPVYLSFSQLGSQRAEALSRPGDNLRLVYPSDLGPKHDTRLLRHKLWLHNKGIPGSDEAVQANAQFAMTLLSDVLGHMADSYSRDLFVERIEHVLGQTPAASIYPQMSLGPGQRFAAKGAAIVQLSDGEKSKPKLLSTWLVP